MIDYFLYLIFFKHHEEKWIQNSDSFYILKEDINISLHVRFQTIPLRKQLSNINKQNIIHHFSS